MFRSCVIFDKTLYPGYRNRKARSGKGSFPCHDARIFIFTLPLVRTLASPQRPTTNCLNFITPLDEHDEFKKCSTDTLKSVVKRLLKGRITNHYSKKKDGNNDNSNNNSHNSTSNRKILGKRKKHHSINGDKNNKKKALLSSKNIF